MIPSTFPEARDATAHLDAHLVGKRLDALDRPLSNDWIIACAQAREASLARTNGGQSNG